MPYWPTFNRSNPLLPRTNNLTLDADSPFYSPNLYASNVVTTAIVPVYQPILDNLSNMGFNHQYDLQRHFEQNLGCDYSLKNPNPAQPPTPNLFVFPYDWRQDNNLTAIKLNDYVKCVQDLYPPGTKVNVIAHSMGGLVVRKYILRALQNNLPHRLGKVITIASPFLGAPESTYQLYTGGDFRGLFSLISLSQGSIQFLAPHLPAMHQLLPSRKYSDFRGGIMVERGDLNGNGISNEKYGFEQIVQVLDVDFPSTVPGTTGSSFHDFAGQDDWANDSSGIRYFHIFGVQKELNTTDGLYIYKSIRCKLGTRLNGCFRSRLYLPRKGPGDKTVPLISTSMGWSQGYVNTTVTDLAPPSMRIFRRSSTDVQSDDHSEHTGLTQDTKVRDLLAYILGVGQQPTWNNELYELSRPGNTGLRTRESFSDYSPSFYLTILGQNELTIRDQRGNTAAIENGFLRNDVMGLNSYEMIANDSAMLTLTTSDTYTVEFRAGTTPFGIELVRGVGNEDLDMAVRYHDLVLAADTRVRFTFSATGGAELRIDVDNDGSYETTVSPTFSVSGSAATDVTPPNVDINIVGGQGSIATVYVTANEFESGVDKVWYSVDGQNFDQYTSPFQITLTSNPITIEAFADDNAGNRSGLISRTVSLTSSVIPVAECIFKDSDGQNRVWFGYQNLTSNAISVPIGGENILFPLPGNKGQITTFQPGLVSHAFSILLKGKRISWRLSGPDGYLHTVMASLATTPTCQ